MGTTRAGTGACRWRMRTATGAPAAGGPRDLAGDEARRAERGAGHRGHGARRRVDCLDVPPRTSGEAEPAPLADGEAMDAAVAADLSSRLVGDGARPERLGRRPPGAIADEAGREI